MHEDLLETRGVRARFTGSQLKKHDQDHKRLTNKKGQMDKPRLSTRREGGKMGRAEKARVHTLAELT
jgi:hypothetical protein